MKRLKDIVPNDFDFSYEEVTSYGYRIDLEQPKKLQEGCSEDRTLLKMSEGELPKLVLPEFSPIENQANQGACQGHSLSTCAENCRVRSGAKHVQLSRACAYYESQRIDNIRGDSGSTINGGIELVENAGICTEADWEYPSSYNPRRPSTWENSVRYKIQGHVLLTDFAKLLDWIAFKGPIHIGIAWSRDIDQQVGQDGTIRTYSGRGGDGHSVALDGLTYEDWQGNPLPGNEPGAILSNSWSERWGFKGRCIVLRRAFESMVRTQWSIFAGLHGTVSPKIDDVEF